MGGGGVRRLPNADQWTPILANAIEEAINAQIDPSLFGPEGAGQVVESLTAVKAALQRLFPNHADQIHYEIRTKTLPDGTTREWVYVRFG